jgi:tRNA dimethylallyltransferase
MTVLPPLLIAGPTASGKSHYALERARESAAVIINADSMQVYSELRVITARPSEADEALVPHVMYGHVPSSEAYSVGRWLSDVRQALAEAKDENWRPIIVGGTGLYFKTLLEGLSPVPQIPKEIRTKWRAAAANPAGLHRQLQDVDPEMAAKLLPNDPQRIVRALEVIETTGKSLAYWQTLPGEPLLKFDDSEAVVISRPREDLYMRADTRLEAMLEMGALDEVAALVQQNLDASLPAMRALGVPQLMQLIAGDVDRETALSEAKLQTRHYIKRQLTWLRRNMSSWKTISKQ